MVKLSFMGGTHKVGGNAVQVKSDEANLLLEYGVKPGTPPEFPGHIRARDVDAIVVGHAHLDHSGGVPLFYLSEKKPYFATRTTSELMKILIKDMIKLNSYYLPFEYLELDNMQKYRNDIVYGQKVKVKDIEFSLLDAGHIPGSAMVDIDVGGKKILYTSDFNTIQTRICRGAKVPRRKYDAVIIESTYAMHEHPERKQLEEEFVKEIKSTVNDGGKVLIPAFAVGRSHEIISVLHAQKFKGNILLDGMARAVNEVMLDISDSVKTPQTYAQAMAGVHIIRGWRDRRQAVRKADAIVAPSGMLQGGTVMFYMEKLALNANNSVYIVSFQVPGTNGSKLLETGMFPIKDRETRVNAKVKHFDFSSHSGRTPLQQFLRGLKGKPDVYVIHGEEESCDFLAEWVRDELDLKGFAPNNEEEFTV
ncbi:MAG TPA: MBL fold metallo-hydrolase [Candidatus Krumholzibacteriaceae bacterium]|nr:MBL fold metallo-hydrolase [Candidatus Krumholzibacteriaceae bacterium]